MEAIALMAAVDGLYDAAKIAALITAIVWIVTVIAPYMTASKPYQGDDNDEF